jgi:signal transduction histidine kinase
MRLAARSRHELRTQTNIPTRSADVTEVRPVLESVIARHRTSTGEHEVILDCAPGLAVRTDADDLDRAISNLIDNAVQHGRPPIIVVVQPAALGQPEGTMIIEVRDHGPGFAAEFLPHAFDRFTRADDARTGDGTGLGLAIVAALARRNGGRAIATNDPAGGGAVALPLPAAPAPVPAAERP